LPRLLRPVTRSVTSRIITTGYVAHPQAPQTHHVLRPSLVSGYSYASTSMPLGFRGMSSCSLFPNSASLLIPRYHSEVHMVRRVGDGVSAAPGILHVQQRRSMATKLKKTKIKAYSSYKMRFRGMASGLYKRWRSGKQHNAHSKTNKQKRQLRRPSVAPPALAKVMKKLNFLG